jgi:hypothetical protein
VARKQADRYHGMNTKIVPNYNGQEASDWHEAKEMAAKDVGVEKAAAFDKKIAEEKATKAG